MVLCELCHLMNWAIQDNKKKTNKQTNKQKKTNKQKNKQKKKTKKLPPPIEGAGIPYFSTFHCMC